MSSASNSQGPRRSGGRPARGGAGRSGGRRRAKAAWSRKKKALVGALSALVIMVGAPFVAFMIAYVMADVPQPEELVNKQVSTIYADDSSTELARIVP